MEKNIKISIITPCRNAEQYIADTIEDIILQKGNFEIEYIVVDGASTDRTCDIAEKYLDDLNKKQIPINCSGVTMKLISEKDGGMYDALVKGFNLISGNIVSYLNADDFYQPNAFAILAELFGNLPNLNWLTGVPSFYNSQGIIIESDWPVIYDNNLIQKGFYNNKALPYIQQESVFFRAKALDNLSFKRLKKFKYAGDAYIWNCFSKKYPLFILSAILSGYRMRPGNLAVLCGDGYAQEMKSLHGSMKLSEAEYNYLYFLHYTWWKESKSIKEKNNDRYITWDSVQHCWRTGKLSYRLDYKLPFSESYLGYSRHLPPGFARRYIHEHLC